MLFVQARAARSQEPKLRTGPTILSRSSTTVARHALVELENGSDSRISDERRLDVGFRIRTAGASGGAAGDASWIQN